jgi:hypothetical protein
MERPPWLDWATEARPYKDGLWIALYPLYGNDRWRIGVVDEWSVLEFI